MAGFIAGILLIALGVLGLGNLVRYIPYPVTTGFTAGIAIIIFSAQLKDFLGLRIENVPSAFLPKMGALLSHLGAIHWPTLALAAGCFLLIRFWPRGLRR
jgi:SulP family sulfate permease